MCIVNYYMLVYVSFGDEYNYQVSDWEDAVKFFGHGVMLHGHEKGVKNDTNGYGQIHKWVHDHHADKLFDFQPCRTTIPDQAGVGKSIPAGWALLSGLFKLWKMIFFF